MAASRRSSSIRLHALGRWLGVNGEGIFGTRPWVRAAAKSAEGVNIRFTTKEDTLYAFLLSRPEGATLTIPGLHTARGATISALGGGRVEWSENDGNLVVKPGPLHGEYAWGLKITPAPHAA